MTQDLNFLIFKHNKMISIKQLKDKDIDLCYEFDTSSNLLKS